MSSNTLYTDLSGYYDLMCADINYQEQSHYVRRLHQLFGNQGRQYLDLACGTGPHVRYFIDYGYQASGLDIHQPMLDLAQKRCAEALFMQSDMSSFAMDEPLDLITCFLYSIHYNNNLEKLKACIVCAYAALKPGGLFCFNAVDKNTINNNAGIKHQLEHEDGLLTFQSGWHYAGQGDQQSLYIQIDKEHQGSTRTWQDTHSMLAISFHDLEQLLAPYFEVHIFEHVYDKIESWGRASGNAIFACVKK